MKFISSSKGEKIAAVITTASVILVMAICIGIDAVVGSGLNWSWYPVLGLAYGWFIAMAAILLDKSKLMGSFIAAGVGILPFLWGIQSLTPAKNWVLPLAAPISILAFIVGVGIVLTYVKLDIGITAKIFLTLMIVSLGYLGVDFIVGEFIGGGSNPVNVIISMSLFFISFLGFGTMYLIRKIAMSSGR